ncbi:DNA-binding transcriptional regulator of sugar metabolism, DeoR/GlpR family [Microbacterium azadirachtae]|uniref:DNA-binding transcriptional regulator of sugar metabolism, DeoR/GlpR family n=1 Tax=Microbacterium azadirachtae TaxID=582680 RepID=A0A1I6I545_9MICO|nr:DeoR/GlpR family DNA-binding transcription regulator [Microbacterium azadirachtae]SFR61842.1 DNA-binding transcriptional regulator of sugar metabolism, DeoR/GlpR family [Microbacterium azadirachtae]
MLVSERRERILAHVREHGTATIPELSSLLGVSPMTIRRDIDLLADEGAVRKVRGGVRAALGAASVRTPAASVSRERREVAALAAGLVEPGMAVGISGGAISLALAEALAAVPELTIVTNALGVSDLFARPDRADEPYTQTVVLTGGVRTPAQALVGPVAVRALEQLHCDIVFLDVHGLDVQAGMTTMNLLEAETDRAFMAAGREVVVLADHRRWGLVGLTTIADLSDIDRLVIDAGLDQPAREQLGAHVGELLIAGDHVS